ncbi:MAG: hypothetical protein U9R66_07780 [Thermodesulfobacteriota bacterium]|nr:hypothetical protein [Thermodesulfobacteriota bacterium]
METEATVGKTEEKKLIAAELTNAFFLNSLLRQQQGQQVDLMDPELVAAITREVNAVYLAFQEVVNGLDEKTK